LNCGKQFQSKRRKSAIQVTLWKQYIWKRQTTIQLAEDYHRSVKWIRKQLESVQVVKSEIEPQELVIVADATFFKKVFGILVFRSSQLRKNLYWREISSEKIEFYLQARLFLESKGFKFLAAVIDGRRGVRNVFADIPVQMCQFHQKLIINRYLTTRPKIPASIELRAIVSTLCDTTREEFSLKLSEWYIRWEPFLKEKTIIVNPTTKQKWFYTHRRTRSAYYSLKRNLPYLFTYQDYPELNIPNTTNSLDGSFTQLKQLVELHRGCKGAVKRKMIDEILSK